MTPNTRDMSVHHSSQSVEWNTPKWILELVSQFFDSDFDGPWPRTRHPIDLDPSSDHGHWVPAERHYTKQDNGLLLPWSGKVFCNPPYGADVPKWVDKACREYNDGEPDEIIMVLPGRPGSKWFAQISDQHAICFLSHRLRFVVDGVPGGPAPFPTAIAYLGGRLRQFQTTFEPHGSCICPLFWAFNTGGNT